MKRCAASILAIALIAFFAAPAQAVKIRMRVEAPASTPPNDTLYLAQQAEALPLTRYTDSLFAIEIDVPKGTLLQFRFTRGSEEAAEVGPKGEPVESRRLRVTGPRDLKLTIANWADQYTPPQSTLTGDVTTHEISGFLQGRRVWIYLPPDYHEATRAYPVLVMLDGQNLFDARTSFAGEWRVDETCEQLIAAGEIEPLIVVGVDNGGARRAFEYTPWVDQGRSEGGGGDAHLKAIRDQLLPWLHAHYRTLEGAENTGFGGSSLGGLMSLRAAFEHPDTFGRIAAFSSTLFWNRHSIIEAAKYSPGQRIYTDMGGLESGQLVDRNGNGVDDSLDDLRKLETRLNELGYGDETLRVLEAEGARHHESAWAERLPYALRFLFPARSGPNED